MQISETFSWFIGVVEDRNDPKRLGRLRVRVFGDHTADKTKIPTEDLPWAQIMLPPTSASLGGVGVSPTGIQQGSWVVGFYMDGPSKQTPFIMGSIHGNAGLSGLPSQGFADPSGNNPQRIKGSDTPYAQAGEFKKSPSYIVKTEQRKIDVDTAVPDKVTSLAQDEPDAYYERVKWSMPQPLGGRGPLYPYNKVEQTESGHVLEVDDTPGAERISEFHMSGTNREILHDGTTHTTIVGKNYKAVLSDDHIYVKGTVNMTVDGDFKQLVKGNYHLEVVGNKTELIRGTRQSSIAKSEHIEIGQDFGCNVTEKYLQRIGGDETRIVDGARDTTIGNTEDLVITNGLSLISLNEIKMFASTQGFELSTTGHLKAASETNMNLETKANLNTVVEGNTENNVGGTYTDNVTGNIDINGARIDLN